MNLLQHLHRHQVFSDLDVSLSQYIARAYNESHPDFKLCVSILNHHTRHGHTCLHFVPEVVERILGSYIIEAKRNNVHESGGTSTPVHSVDLPSGEELCQRVTQIIQNQKSTLQPLILDDSFHLYFHRHWVLEQAVFNLLSERINAQLDPIDQKQVESIFSKLLDNQKGEHIPQKGSSAYSAIQRALERRLSIVSGGPGTGKTTITLQILGALVLAAHETAKQPPIIALLAPTGKAAARLSFAVQQGLQYTQWPSEITQSIPTEASTIHRLLSTEQRKSTKTSSLAPPLPHDVFIVDEASMIDLELMHRLLSRMKDTAKLILVGDPNQLSPVHVGTVFSDLCGPVESPSHHLDNHNQPAPPIHTLLHCKTELVESFRFSTEQGIGQLAEATLNGDAQGALDILRNPQLAEVTLHPTEQVPELLNHFVANQNRVFHDADPVSALTRAEQFRILCPFNHGALGVTRVNQHIEQLLRQGHHIPAHAEFYHRRLILFLRNDYDLGLYNGDIGIIECATQHEGVRVFCPAQDGTERYFSVEGLPSHQAAYAMSIHKSQGSEFDEVLIVLPDLASSLMSRELLYTAITRARKRLRIVASSSVLAQTVQHQNQRASGLRNRFWLSQ